MLEWIKAIGPILVSWPVALLVVALILRRQIQILVRAFVSRSRGNIELGPIKMQLGELVADGEDAVQRLNQITEVMAESKIFELEFTLKNLGLVFSPEEKKKMEEHILKLKGFTVNKPSDSDQKAK